MPRVLIYYGLTLLLSWSYWGCVIASHRGWLAERVPLTPFGAFGPAIAALITVAWFDGRAGLAALARSLGPRGSRATHALFALAAWPLLVLGAIAIAALRGSSLAPGPGIGPGMLLLVVFEVFVFTSLAEEPGWRGLLLPELLRRLHPALAGLVTGACWAIWHVPLFFIPGTAQSNIPFTLFAVSVLAASMVYTALYTRSRPSIVPVLILHTAQDVSLQMTGVVWPAAGASAGFWYAYFWLVVVAGALATAFLLVRPRSAADVAAGPRAGTV